MRSTLEAIKTRIDNPGTQAGVFANGDVDNAFHGCGIDTLLDHLDAISGRNFLSKQDGGTDATLAAWKGVSGAFSELKMEADALWSQLLKKYSKYPGYDFLANAEYRDPGKILAFFHSRADDGSSDDGCVAAIIELGAEFQTIPIIDLGAPLEPNSGLYEAERARDLLSVISATASNSGGNMGSDRACGNVLDSIVLVRDMLAASTGELHDAPGTTTAPSKINIGSAPFFGIALSDLSFRQFNDYPYPVTPDVKMGNAVFGVVGFGSDQPVRLLSTLCNSADSASAFMEMLKQHLTEVEDSRWKYHRVFEVSDVSDGGSYALTASGLSSILNHVVDASRHRQY
jgi:hypothetical protein